MNMKTSSGEAQRTRRTNIDVWYEDDHFDMIKTADPPFAYSTKNEPDPAFNTLDLNQEITVRLRKTPRNVVLPLILLTGALLGIWIVRNLSRKT